MKTKHVMLGIIAGAAAGATLGVLFAPDKGSRTRKKIVNKTREYVDNVSEKINGIVGSIKQPFVSAKDDVEQLIANADLVEDGAASSSRKMRKS